VSESIPELARERIGTSRSEEKLVLRNPRRSDSFVSGQLNSTDLQGGSRGFETLSAHRVLEVSGASRCHCSYFASSALHSVSPIPSR
jgi:hypothetical protein